MAVLPQVVALGSMAGLLWLVRIKEIVRAPAVFQKDSNQVIMRFDLPEEDRPKIEVGSVLHGAIVGPTGKPGPEFQATVTRVEPTQASSTSIAWQVTAQLRVSPDMGEGISPEILEAAAPVSVAMWSRTRRALSVVFNREEVTETGKGSAAGNIGLGGVP